jgi:hypothetical protein
MAVAAKASTTMTWRCSSLPPREERREEEGGGGEEVAKKLELDDVDGGIG